MTYDDDDYVTDRERKIARGLAIAMHVGVVLLFIFGVAWQKRHSEPAAVVDLWSSLSPPKQEPVPAPKPVPKVEVKPEPPRPVPKVAPPPEPKPIPKADIALRDKLEKERKVKEQQELEKKRELEKEKQKADEKKKAQQAEMKKADEKVKLEKERLAQEAKLAQEKTDIAAKLAKERASAAQSLNDKYITLIQNHIKRKIVEPPNLQGDPEAIFNVILIPGGEVLTVKLARSSGVPAYDAAAERAILSASPLPLPSDPALFQQFRELNLKIRPK
ncbi:MAG TPA: cell envelope integrity protein TolA [Burkholderiales bacterium]|nr:cell envelope integrity protein TolA [Burkholderiales bacterium]